MEYKIDDPLSKLSTGLALGKTGLSSMWKTPKTNIVLLLDTADIRPFMRITYVSVEYIDLLGKKGLIDRYEEQQKALDDL